MFEQIITIVGALKSLLYYSLYYSFKIGQFLVYTLNLILNNFVAIFINLSNIFIIIFESFTVFYQDIVQGLQLFLEVLRQIWEATGSAFSTTIWNTNNILRKISYVLSETYTVVENFILSNYTLIITITKLIKHIIVLFGAGVWFAITFIPVSVVNLMHLFIYMVKNSLKIISSEIVRNIRNLKDCFTNLYTFVTDVPTESVIGLIIAGCLIYTLTQFYVSLYNNTRQLGRYILDKFCTRPINVRRNEGVPINISLPINRRPQIRRTHEPSSLVVKANISDDRYCVICQEQIKCILVLPCRHVCMCMECNSRLQLYNNTCPICRNDIESTMKIFV